MTVYQYFVVVVVTNLRLSSVRKFALSCYLEHCKPGLARVWQGLDVLGQSHYVELPAVRTANISFADVAVNRYSIINFSQNN